MQATAWGVDAARRIDPAELRKEGASFVCLYLAPYPQQQWKIRTIEDTIAYIREGFHIVYNWEANGHPDGGFSAGVRDAHIAQDELNDRHMSDAPVYFNAADEQFPNRDELLAYHRGVASVIPWGRTGCYGSADIVDFLHANQACRFYWQTYAWSGGRISPWATLYQRKNTPTIDYDVAYAADFGQYPRPASAPVGPPPADWQDMKLTDTYRDWAGNVQTVQGWMDHQDQRSYHTEQMLLTLMGRPGTPPATSTAAHQFAAQPSITAARGEDTPADPNAFTAPSWQTQPGTQDDGQDQGPSWGAPIGQSVERDEQGGRLQPNPGPLVPGAAPGAHYSQQWGH